MNLLIFGSFEQKFSVMSTLRYQFISGIGNLCNFGTIHLLAIYYDVFPSHPQFIDEMLLYLHKMAEACSKNQEVYFHGQCTW